MQFLNSATLAIDNTTSFGGNVGTSSYNGPLLDAFGSGDLIDLKNFAASGVNLNYDSTTGLLQLTNSTGQAASLKFASTALGVGTFHATGDGVSGTAITYA